MVKENYRRVNLKRKVFSRGAKHNFKRFKRTPKYIRDNPENQIAKQKEKDVFDFSESEPEDDLGMGIDISDLPFLDDNHSGKQKDLIALTQDSVRPLFTDETYDEAKLEEALNDLRYTSFRPSQKETIKRILFGRSTLFISPTGSGKSLCYQLPALLYWRYRKYMTIVVSPLISLMEDQMNNFPASLKAVSIHSGHNKTQRRRAIEQLVNGEAQVAFLSPEAIVGGILDVEDLKNLPPVGFVCIDEAHCLSEWSHNFRPAYLQFFKILHEQMSIKTYLGLTATATRATSFAIARNLIINPDTDVIGRTTIPDNLILSVSLENNKEKAILTLLKSPTFRIMPSIIVYCNRRDETEAVASVIRTAMQGYSTLVEVPKRKKTGSSNESISNDGSPSSDSSDQNHMKLTWHAEAYHAGLSIDTRKRIQRQFVKGEIRVVVATIAFGMGINKANVRAIIHYDMPSSFESYVQEIGRAGRDGKPAQCHMFLKADMTDLFYQQRNIYSSVAEPKNLKKLTEYLMKRCLCQRFATQDDMAKLDDLNKLSPHKVISDFKTNFTNIPYQDSDDEESCDILRDESSETNVARRKKCTKYMHQSIVKKHRCCHIHPISFSVEEATNEINLRLESIITLICQLQQAYPQLKIDQFPPARATCNLFCYRGPTQMETLARSIKPVEVALFEYKTNHLKTHGTKPETPNRLTFDTIAVASKLGKSLAETMRQLRKSEWELVEKTGRFRRSQVRVNFEGNFFHLKLVGDLSDSEIQEINSYLIDANRVFEKLERKRMAKVFHTFRRHCVQLENMSNKDVRLISSFKLKEALNSYFASPVTVDGEDLDSRSKEDLEFEASHVELSELKEQAIRKSAKAFISAHSTNYTPRTIARIFQGISTPNYPSEHWGSNKLWWRIHLDVDFIKLSSIIEDELLRV